MLSIKLHSVFFTSSGSYNKPEVFLQEHCGNFTKKIRRRANFHDFTSTRDPYLLSKTCIWGKTIPLILFLFFFSISILLLELYFFLQQPNKALAKIFWNLVVISPMTLSSRKVSIKKRSILWAFLNRMCWRTTNFNKTKTIQNNTETHTQKMKTDKQRQKANKRQTTERQKKRECHRKFTSGFTKYRNEWCGVSICKFRGVNTAFGVYREHEFCWRGRTDNQIWRIDWGREDGSILFLVLVSKDHSFGF